MPHSSPNIVAMTLLSWLSRLSLVWRRFASENQLFGLLLGTVFKVKTRQLHHCNIRIVIDNIKTELTCLIRNHQYRGLFLSISTNIVNLCNFYELKKYSNLTFVTYTHRYFTQFCWPGHTNDFKCMHVMFVSIGMVEK